LEAKKKKRNEELLQYQTGVTSESTGAGGKHQFTSFSKKRLFHITAPTLIQQWMGESEAFYC